MRSQGRCAIHKGETGMISFAGRVAIVTGGSSGIGEATVRKLSALGANVLIADVDAARGQEIAAQLSASGVRADLVVTDILVEEQIVALVDRTVRDFGRIDVLINSAGIPRTIAPDAEVAELTTHDWNTTLAGHLTSTMLTAKYVLPHMIAAGGGNIVNVSSLSSQFATMNLSAYAAAKAGVNQLSKEIAATYGRDNIRCNVVIPGVVLTPRGRKTMGAEMLQLFADETPLPRLAEAEDLANAIIFFASDMSSMITGQSLVVDGGMMTKLPYWLPKMRASRGAVFDEAAAKYQPEEDE